MGQENRGTIVEIWLKTWGGDSPIIKVACESVEFDYHRRRVIFKNIGGCGNPRRRHMLPMGIVEGSEVIVKFLPDAAYELHIDKQVHHLPKLVESE